LQIDQGLEAYLNEGGGRWHLPPLVRLAKAWENWARQCLEASRKLSMAWRSPCHQRQEVPELEKRLHEVGVCLQLQIDQGLEAYLVRLAKAWENWARQCLEASRKLSMAWRSP
jgi:hypothetical protein